MNATSTSEIGNLFWNTIIGLIPVGVIFTLSVKIWMEKKRDNRVLSLLKVELGENLKIFEIIESLIADNIHIINNGFFLEEYSGWTKRIKTGFYEKSKNELIIANLSNEAIIKIDEAYDLIYEFTGPLSSYDDDPDPKFVKGKILDAIARLSPQTNIIRRFLSTFCRSK